MPRPIAALALAALLLPSCGGEKKPAAGGGATGGAPATAAAPKKEEAPPAPSGFDLSRLKDEKPAPAPPAANPSPTPAPAPRTGPPSPSPAPAATPPPAPKAPPAKAIPGMPEGLTEEEQKQYAGLDEEEREEFRKQMKEELEKRAKEKPAVAPAGPAVPEAPAPPARGPGRPATPGGELAPPDLRSILVGLASTDVETRAEAAESARRYPDKDVAAKHVMRVLKDKDAEVRQLAASTLGALGQAAALPALLDVIQTDRNDGVRATAIRAIKEIGGPDAVATLRGIVRDGNEPGDRASALSILTDLGIVGDVRDLIKGATRELSPEIRLQAAVAVRTFLLKDYEAFILPLLDDASDGVIVEALRACSAIKARGAVGKAVALLGDAEHEEIVTDAAAVSLKAITGEDLGYADTLLETQRLVAIDAWKQWWKKNGEAWDKGTYAPGKK